MLTRKFLPQQALPSVISADQTGFISGRNSSFNSRQRFNITESSDPEILLHGLDYCVTVPLPVSLQMVRDLAPLIFAGAPGRGSLSSLLFALPVEPLATWLHPEAREEGISRNGITHKLSLYVENLLLYALNPVSSILVITDILTQFGKCSIN